jgi:hypothetical protein
MKAQMIAMMALVLGATSAQASTFVCVDAAETIKVRVNESVMVLSDPSVAHGRKTIARFTADNGVLTSTDYVSTMAFEADVDLRFNDSERAGEYLLGTRLGEVDSIRVFVEVDGGLAHLRLTKRNGDKITRTLICE